MLPPRVAATWWRLLPLYDLSIMHLLTTFLSLLPPDSPTAAQRHMSTNSRHGTACAGGTFLWGRGGFSHVYIRLHKYVLRFVSDSRVS